MESQNTTVSAFLFVEEEDGYTHLSATLVVEIAGAARMTFTTDGLDPPNAEEATAFQAALATGADARLELARRGGGVSWLVLAGDRATIEIEHLGSVGGGLGVAEVAVPREAARGALSALVGEWVRACRPRGGDV